MNRFTVQKYETFFTAIIFEVEERVVMVQHWKDKVIKIPGGSYRPYSEDISKREQDEAYDNLDRDKIMVKIHQTIVKMMGKRMTTNLSPKIKDIVRTLVDKYEYNPPALQGIIEYIEEVGVIPMNLKEHYTHMKGIRQFFFVCDKAIAFSAKKGIFIDISTLADLPQKNRDYEPQDSDVQKIIYMSADDSKEMNLAYSQIAPVEEYFSQKKAA